LDYLHLGIALRTKETEESVLKPWSFPNGLVAHKYSLLYRITCIISPSTSYNRSGPVKDFAVDTQSYLISFFSNVRW